MPLGKRDRKCPSHLPLRIHVAGVTTPPFPNPNRSVAHDLFPISFVSGLRVIAPLRDLYCFLFCRCSTSCTRRLCPSCAFHWEHRHISVRNQSLNMSTSPGELAGHSEAETVDGEGHILDLDPGSPSQPFVTFLFSRILTSDATESSTLNFQRTHSPVSLSSQRLPSTSSVSFLTTPTASMSQWTSTTGNVAAATSQSTDFPAQGAPHASRTVIIALAAGFAGMAGLCAVVAYLILRRSVAARRGPARMIKS